MPEIALIQQMLIRYCERVYFIQSCGVLVKRQFSR